MAQQIKTFRDIIDAVREQLGVQSTDTVATNKIKRLINMVYLDEVVPFKRWKWLQKETSVMHDVYYTDNTNYATVTNDSTTVTLNNAPNSSLGSFKGYKFAVDGFPEIYEVTSHTAGSTAVTINTGYLGITSATAAFKIWRDKVNLPVDCKETIDVWHARHSSKMKGVGTQELRTIINEDPKREGYPSYFTQTDFFDPSPGDAETEADRYRQLQIYPAITLNPVTIHVKYVEEVDALDADTDEPVMPIGDRAVLVYGTLMHAWTVVGRDPEMASLEAQKYNAKLSRMAGEIEEGFDQPTIGGKARYLNAIRHRGLHRKNLAMLSNAGSSSYANPTYAKDIILEGGNITANFTVASGITIDGRDISEDGAALDALVAGTQATLTDNTTGTVAQWSTATYKRVSLGLAIQRGTAHETTFIEIVTDGVNVAWSEGGGTILSGGGPQVVFSCDVNGSNVRLLFDTTANTGNDATVTYTSITTGI